MKSFNSIFLMRSAILLGVLLLLPAVAVAQGEGDEHSRPVPLQILAFNDFHGHVDSTFTIAGFPLGGVEYLAANMRFFEARAENTVIVSAGDLIGASPFLSGFFHDEPTIEAANLIGVDFAAVGNHEFDDGAAELLRMQSGGCHPVDGCQDGDGFAGAEFPFLAANVVDRTTGETFFPPVAVKNFTGVKVAFIGLTLEGTASIVHPEGIADLEFYDEAETINAIVPVLRQHNIEAIVVLLHQGGFQTLPGGIDDCNGIAGPVIDIVERTDPAVDLFITGHTHAPYICVIDGRPVTSAWSYGILFTKIDVELNRVTKDMTVLSAFNVPNFRFGKPAPDLAGLIGKYDWLASPIADAVIGIITADIRRVPNAAGESALGDVIADSQLAATAAPELGGADVAFMNSGGIRISLFYSASGSEADGEVTFGEAWAVQPFNNRLVTMTLRGAQIHELLEMQFEIGSVLQVSEGFEYAWSASAPLGDKVDPAMIRIGGMPIDLGAEYRVTVNDFLAAGGGGFGAVLLAGTDRLEGALDVDAFADYFAVHSPVMPGPQDRIMLVP